jgi:thiamine biosynthesis lipoprotein
VASLDFSGIAKGHGRSGGQALHELGCASWLVEIGGELTGQG